MSRVIVYVLLPVLVIYSILQFAEMMLYYHVEIAPKVQQVVSPLGRQ